MNGVHLVMGTANAYIQAPGLLKQAGEWIKKYGSHAFIITGEKSWTSCQEQLTVSLDEWEISYERHPYSGECSYEEVRRLKQQVSEQVEVILGVGAGKVLDTAKAVSHELGLPFIAVPTLAATCAAVTNLSIMYSTEGVYLNYVTYVRNTMLVLVDTDVLAVAPVRFLVAGIGDTLAKWYESKASSTGKEHNLPTIGGLQIAKLCYDTLIQYSEEAVADAKAGISSPALQKVIDAIILYSGLVGGLGEDNCRSAAAHAVHNGLTVLPESHDAYHGEKVAYGIMVQLMLENRSQDEIEELAHFYRQIGLPVSLWELGIQRRLSMEELQEIAAISMLPESTMSMMPIPVTAELLVDKIIELEAWQGQSRNIV